MMLAQSPPPQVTLSNGPLKVLVYLPDLTRGFFRGTRFDWAGGVGRLEYANHVYYDRWFSKMDPNMRDWEVTPEVIAGPNTAITGPVEVVPMDEWRRQLEVNLLGQIAVTRELLPAIVRARGRIVNMSSIGGRVANPLFGPYAASKFGLEAVTDALRREVAMHGVRVVSVEPGGIATPIWAKGTADGRRVTSGMTEDQARRYGALIAAIAKRTEQMGREGLPPEEVAKVVGEAVTAERPREGRIAAPGRDAAPGVPPGSGVAPRRHHRPPSTEPGTGALRSAPGRAWAEP